MKLYRFSPIDSEEQLLEAINYIHSACHKLCMESFGKYYPNSGNMGVFCHYDSEYEILTKIRKELTLSAEDEDRKYFEFKKPIVIPAQGDIPETTYTHLYIRKP